MENKEFGEAAVEVLDILKHVDSEDFKKIPAKFIGFLEENKSEYYICNLDHSKKIEEMELKPKTEALLGYIYLNYWSDDAGKKDFEQRLRENEEIVQNELLYGFTDDMFNQEYNEEPKVETNEEYLPKTYKKESIISKLVGMLRNVFRRK